MTGNANNSLDLPNHYLTLGIPRDATSQQIKKAYRDRCLEHHPDKGNGTEADQARRTEMTAEIIEAYGVLSDPELRIDYDDLLDTCVWEHDLKEDAESEVISGRTEHNSERFKRIHTTIVDALQKNARDVPRFIGPTLTHTKNPFFQEILEKGNIASDDLINMEQLAEAFPETESLVIHLLHEFFSYKLYGDNIKLARLQILMHQLQQMNQEASLGKHLLNILNDFLDIAENIEEKTPSDMLEPFKHLLQLVASTPKTSIPVIEPLLQTIEFREAYKQTVQTALENPASLRLVEEGIQKITMVGPVDKIVRNLREVFKAQRAKLRHYRENKKLTTEEKVQYEKLEKENQAIQKGLLSLKNLDRFCADVSLDPNLSDDPLFLRKRAYTTLDWCETIGAHGQAMTINTMLLAGAYFQAAAQAGNRANADPAVIAADMQLAIIAYTQAYNTAQKLSPDQELRITWSISAFLTPIEYDMAQPLLRSVRARTLQILDFYPVYSELRTATDTIYYDDETLNAMRGLLNRWVDRAYQKNVDKGPSTPLVHEPVDLLYRSYDAAISKWYNPLSVSLSQVRFDMMYAFLSKNGWHFRDIANNISPPCLMVDVDNEGWFRGEIIPFPNTVVGGVSLQKYKDLRGMQINFNTGDFLLGLIPAANAKEALFTQYDIYDALGREDGFSYFSLDEPKQSFGVRYHPFQEIVSSKGLPTELRNTMLETDYVLKFITTGYQVQFVHPFEIKSIASILDKIATQSPALAQAIREYYATSKPGAAHRFWIEQGELPFTSDVDQEAGTKSYGFGELPMHVRTHCLLRDLAGELIDDEASVEGWPIYVLDAIQLKALKEKQLSLPDSFALILQKGMRDVSFVEYGDYEPKTLSNGLLPAHQQALFSAPDFELNAQGRLLLKKKSAALDSTVYHLTRSVTDAARKAHRFSAERVLAESLTTHYADLANIFPEFKRLQALAALSSIGNIVRNIAHNLKESLPELESNLANFPLDIRNALEKTLLEQKTIFWNGLVAAIQTEIQSGINEHTPKMSAEIRQDVLNVYQQVYKNISDQSTRLNTAVADAKQRICTDNGLANWGVIPSAQRIELENKFNADVAAAKASQWASLRAQVHTMYQHKVPHLNPVTYNQRIDQLMQGNHGQLANDLITAANIPMQVKNSVHNAYRKALMEQHSSVPKPVIDQFLNGNAAALIQALHPVVLAEAIQAQKNRWTKQIAVNKSLLKQLQRLGVQFESSPVESAHIKTCPWVPSSSSYNSHDTRQVHGGVLLTAASKNIAQKADSMYRQISTRSCVFKNSEFDLYEADKLISKYKYSLPGAPEFFMAQMSLNSLERKVQEIRSENRWNDLNSRSSSSSFLPMSQPLFISRPPFMEQPSNMLNFRVASAWEAQQKEHAERIHMPINSDISRSVKLSQIDEIRENQSGQINLYYFSRPLESAEFLANISNRARHVGMLLDIPGQGMMRVEVQPATNDYISAVPLTVHLTKLQASQDLCGNNCWVQKVGKTRLSESEINHQIVEWMSSHGEFHLLGTNCQTFVNDLISHMTREGLVELDSSINIQDLERGQPIEVLNSVYRNSTVRRH
jgi:hypothetical protein